MQYPAGPDCHARDESDPWRSVRGLDPTEGNPCHLGTRATPALTACRSTSAPSKESLCSASRVLFSLLLRHEFGEPDNGMMEASAQIPAAEAEALTRAMARAEPEVPGDRRTKGQRDADRFLIVVERIQEVMAAAIHRRGAA